MVLDGRVFMRKRQITLEDGRYLIFYAFEERGKIGRA
jgi:hypothetical protein